MSVLNRDADKKLSITTTKAQFIFESYKYVWRSGNDGVSVLAIDKTAQLFFPWSNIVFTEVNEVEV